jgi:hypothetical protein
MGAMSITYASLPLTPVPAMSCSDTRFTLLYVYGRVASSRLLSRALLHTSNKATGFWDKK